MILRKAFAVFSFSALGLVACAVDVPMGENQSDETIGTDEQGLTNLYSVSGPKIASGADTEAWSATNAWSDKNTSAAKKAGIAWPANSGLTWDQKYQKWLSTVERAHDLAETFFIVTPFGGRKFKAPSLECAEVGMFLRVTFSSWYHLPFFMKGWDSSSGSYM